MNPTNLMEFRKEVAEGMMSWERSKPYDVGYDEACSDISSSLEALIK